MVQSYSNNSTCKVLESAESFAEDRNYMRKNTNNNNNKKESEDLEKNSRYAV